MPSRLATAIGRRFDDFGDTGNQLVLRINGDRHVRCAVRQFHLPRGCATGLITCGEYGFDHRVLAHGQGTTDGIARCVGRTNHIAGVRSLMGCFESRTCQSIATGVLLVDLDEAFSLDIIEIQMIEAYGVRSLAAGGSGHPLDHGDFGTTRVANMDHEVLHAIVIATTTVKVIGTCIDSNMSQRAIGFTEDNHITRD